jgi:hypothetical protein
MQRLLRIHPGFQIFMIPEVDPDCCTCFCRRYTQERASAEALARQCNRCWGGIDEVLVIMGVKLMLEEEEYVLGETMLLRRLAALHELPTNFVCWSHQMTFLPKKKVQKGRSKSPRKTRKSRIEPPRKSDLCSDLFSQHREAFMALCHHLGWREEEDKTVADVADDLDTSEEEEEEEDSAAVEEASPEDIPSVVSPEEAHPKEEKGQEGAVVPDLTADPRPIPVFSDDGV